MICRVLKSLFDITSKLYSTTIEKTKKYFRVFRLWVKLRKGNRLGSVPVNHVNLHFILCQYCGLRKAQFDYWARCWGVLAFAIKSGKHSYVGWNIYTTRYEFHLLDELDIQPIQLPSMLVFASKRVTRLLSKHQALSHSFIY